MLKRRRLKRTDYRQKLTLLKSGKPRVVVRRGLNMIHASIVEYDEKGDKVITTVLSKALTKYGWKGHLGNIPAAYLTGLLLGYRAKEKNIEEVVLDIGLQTSVKGCSLYAFAKGLLDSGVKLNVNKEVLPSEERLTGKHISNYAEKLKKENPELYKKQFSLYIKNGISPEKITEHFSAVKKTIIEKHGDKK